MAQGFCAPFFRLMFLFLSIALMFGSIFAEAASSEVLFEPYQLLPMNARPSAVALADMNGDGRTDIVAMATYVNDPLFDYKSYVYIFFQDSNGNIESPVRYPIALRYPLVHGDSLGISDMNNDGRPDIVLGLSHNGLGIMYQNADGTFAPVQMVSETSTFLVRALDINRDGRVDIVAITWGENSFEVYLQQPDGTLAAPVSYPLNHRGWEDLAVADVNNDGLLDVVVSSYSSIGVSFQQMNGSFGNQTYIDIGVQDIIRGMSVGDINGDGVNEIVVTYGGNQPYPRLAVIEQDGFGAFKAPVTYPTYDIPARVAIADFNGDGRKDIVIQHPGWSAMGVYTQKPDGTLQAEKRYAFPYGSFDSGDSLAIGDINHDGLPDVVMADLEGLIILRHVSPPKGNEWVLGLGTLGGYWSVSMDASDDGGIVVGSAAYEVTFAGESYAHAFLWTWAGGMVDLGTLGGRESEAYGISADGKVVVGASDISYYRHAFKWTQSQGMVDLGTLPGGYYSEAFSASSDGSVITGTAVNSWGYNRAFRWDQSGGMIDIGTLPGGLGARGYDISANGSVIVGWSGTAEANENLIHAFRWTQSGGMADLGTLPGGFSSQAHAVSADGSVIVGWSETASGATHAFRWTQSGGMVDLGTLPGGYSSAAHGVSADGSIVVGRAEDADGNVTAFRWTAQTGLHPLNEWLIESGQDLSDRDFYGASSISADGKVIVGQLNDAQAFVARVYQSDVNNDMPIVVTSGVSSVAATAAQVSGRIINDRGVNLASGICWSRHANPTTSDNCIENTAGSATFNQSITNLMPNTSYHARAFVTNHAGTSYGRDVQFTTTPVQYILTINISGNGNGRITYGSEVSSCWQAYPCTKIFDGSGVVNLTASPEWWSTFVGWSGGTGSASCSGMGSCTFEITADTSITAEFVAQQNTLTVLKSGNADGTVLSDNGTLSWSGNTGTGSFNANTTARLRPQEGYGATFAGWSGCDWVLGNECMVSMHRAMTVIAMFDLKQYTLTVNATGSGSGTVTSSLGGISFGYPGSSADNALFSHGSSVTLTAASAMAIAGWTGACSEVGGTPMSATCTINNFNDDVAVTATFIPCRHSLGVSFAAMASPGGTSNVSITSSNTGCSWTATSNSPWITITSGNSGVGAGSVLFSVEPNMTGAVRKGTLTIAGLTYSVIQGTTSYVEKIGIYANGNWYLDGTADGLWNGAALDQTAYFGFAGAVPVRGDWDGNGIPRIGVYHDGYWYLDMNADGAWNGADVDKTVHFGFSGASPVVGDWSNTGATKIGVYANGHWYLDVNGNGVWDGEPTDKACHFGFPGAVPVTGHWGGAGPDRIGVYANGYWYLDMDGDCAWNGANDAQRHFGFAGALPVTGDWNDTGTSKVGVYADGHWYLDVNGNGAWDGNGTDASYYFGFPGAVPLSGSW